MPKAKKPAKKTAKKPAPKAKGAKPAKKAASVKVKDLSLEGGKKGRAADVRGGDGTILPGTQDTSRDLQITRTPIRTLGGGGTAQTVLCQPNSAGAQSITDAALGGITPTLSR